MVSLGARGLGRSLNPVQISGGWINPTASGDTQKVYLADAAGGGSDSNNGLSEGAPKLTVTAAFALLRDGYPDWLHIKRGSVFVDQQMHISKNGRSPDERLVVTTYGTGARPQFRGTDGLKRSGGGATPATRDYIHVEGLDFYNYKRDPADAAFDPLNTGSGSLVGTMKYWTIQDCRFRFYLVNCTVQKFGGSYCSNVRFHRCIFLDSWGREVAPSSHSQGLYCEGVNGLEISECFFDHNGWNEHASLAGIAGRTIFNHNMYLQADATVANRCENVNVWGNTSCRGSSHGIQQRSGGTQRRNLFLKNAIAHFCGGAEATEAALVESNVVMMSDDITGALLRGWGCELMKNAFGGTYRGNVYLFRTSANQIAAMFYNSSTPTPGQPVIQVLDNVAYQWANAAGKSFDIPAPVAAEFNLDGNIKDGNDQAGSPVAMVDDDRTFSSYMSSVGLSGDEDEFIAWNRDRGIRVWDQRYTAGAVVDYFKTGYAPVGGF